MRAEDWWVRRSTEGTDLITQSGLVMRRCQSFAPLCASAFEHKLPTFGAHSYTKAVCLGTSAIVRLKGPLHVTMLLENVSAENSKTIETALVCQGRDRSGMFALTSRFGGSYCGSRRPWRSSRLSSSFIALKCSVIVSNNLSEVARRIFDSSTILSNMSDCSETLLDNNIMSVSLLPITTASSLLPDLAP